MIDIFLQGSASDQFWFPWQWQCLFLEQQQTDQTRACLWEAFPRQAAAREQLVAWDRLPLIELAESTSCHSSASIVWKDIEEALASSLLTQGTVGQVAKQR